MTIREFKVKFNYDSKVRAGLTGDGKAIGEFAKRVQGEGKATETAVSEAAKKGADAQVKESRKAADAIVKIEERKAEAAEKAARAIEEGAAAAAKRVQVIESRQAEASEERLRRRVEREEAAAKRIADRDIREAKRAADAQERELDRVAKAREREGKRGSKYVSDKAIGAAKNAGTAMTIGATVPIGMAARQGIGLAGDLEQSLNVLQYAGEATQAQMVAVGRRAKELGNDLTLPATSATDAATAMLELVKADVSVDESMVAAKGTLQLAAAAHLDAAAAAKIQASELNAFGLAGSQAGHVADVLAGAANNAQGEVSDMAVGFAQASATFHGAKLSLDDLATSMTLMAKAGVTGSDAGTSLRTMIQFLGHQTPQAKAAIRALGIEIYDAQGNMRPYRDLIDQFSTAFAKMTVEQQSAANMTIFGQDASRAAQIVLEGGLKTYDATSAAVTKTGNAAGMAAAQNKGLKGALDALDSSWETLTETLAEPVLKPGSELIRGLAQITSNLSEASPATKTVIGTFVGLLAIAGPTTLALGTFAGAINNITAYRQAYAAKALVAAGADTTAAGAAVAGTAANTGLGASQTAVAGTAQAAATAETELTAAETGAIGSAQAAAVAGSELATANTAVATTATEAAAATNLAGSSAGGSVGKIGLMSGAMTALTGEVAVATATLGTFAIVAATAYAGWKAGSAIFDELDADAKAQGFENAGDASGLYGGGDRRKKTRERAARPTTTKEVMDVYGADPSKYSPQRKRVYDRAKWAEEHPDNPELPAERAARDKAASTRRAQEIERAGKAAHDKALADAKSGILAAREAAKRDAIARKELGLAGNHSLNQAIGLEEKPGRTRKPRAKAEEKETARSLLLGIGNAVNTPTGQASCAFFASQVLKQAGYQVTKEGGAKALGDQILAHGGQVVGRMAAKAGDLVRFHGNQYGAKQKQADGSYKRSGYHVGVYLGNGEVLQSSNGKKTVRNLKDFGGTAEFIRAQGGPRVGRAGGRSTDYMKPMDVEAFKRAALGGMIDAAGGMGQGGRIANTAFTQWEAEADAIGKWSQASAKANTILAESKDPRTKFAKALGMELHDYKLLPPEIQKTAKARAEELIALNEAGRKYGKGSVMGVPIEIAQAIPKGIKDLNDKRDADFAEMLEDRNREIKSLGTLSELDRYRLELQGRAFSRFTPEQKAKLVALKEEEIATGKLVDSWKAAEDARAEAADREKQAKEEKATREKQRQKEEREREVADARERGEKVSDILAGAFEESRGSVGGFFRSVSAGWSSLVTEMAATWARGELASVMARAFTPRGNAGATGGGSFSGGIFGTIGQAASLGLGLSGMAQAAGKSGITVPGFAGGLITYGEVSGKSPVKGSELGLGFARGGRPPVRTKVWVGEDGPELAEFDSPVRIHSAGRSRSMAGGTTINYTTNNSFADVSGVKKNSRGNATRQGRQLKRMLRRNGG